MSKPKHPMKEVACKYCGVITIKRDLKSTKPYCTPCNARRNKLQKDYNMTLEEFDDMMEQQNNCCKICNKLVHRSTNNGNNKTVYANTAVVDHCHSTDKVRGILCSNCNFAIGKLHDSPGFALSCYYYLKENI